jgi:ribosome-associated toxin RatA of RatAB toxin-antitoxin module
MKLHLRPLAFAFLTTIAATGFLPGTARAADEEAAKLEASGKAQRYTVKTTEPANDIDTGGAAIHVNAPIDVVRRVVTDYRHYEKYIKPFKQSKLISRSKGVSEVYFEVPILHGAATVWVVTLIGAPEKQGKEERIVAKMKSGNVDDFRAVWRLRAVDAEHTIVKLEILVDPKIPAPASIVTPELCTAAEKAVTGVRENAEKNRATVAADASAAAATKAEGS